MNERFLEEYKELKPKVKKIIKLAKDKDEYDRKGPNSTSLDGNSLEEVLNYHMDSEPSQKLENAFLDLSDDELMLMQALMYIGREEYNNIEETKIKEVVLYYLKSLGFELGNSIANRDAEISQMTGKAPLGDYLQQGLKRIGL